MRSNKEKEFNRMFTGLGVAQSVMISKPKHIRYIVFVVVFLLVLFISSFILWYMFRGYGYLAKNISSKSQFYLSLKISNIDSNLLNKMYTKFVQVNSSEVYGSKEILSMFESDIEIAKLETGEVVLVGRLKDKSEWLSLNEILEKDCEQINDLNIDAPRLLKLLEPDSDWFWYIKNNRIYIISNKSVPEKINFNIKKSVSKMINASRKDFMVLYSNNLSRLSGIQNPHVNSLAESIYKPFIFYAGLDGKDIIFRTNDLPDKDKNLTKNTIKKLYQTSNFDVKAYISDIRSLDVRFEKNVLHILNEIQGFISKTSGIDIDKLDKISAFSNFAVFISLKNSQKIEENDWLIVSDSLDLDILERFGMSSFAKQHPIRVENVLRDGSIMIEMRANEEGLLWEDYSIVFNNQNINFKLLQANGENRYFVGEIFGLGKVLTNSEAMLNKILENYSSVAEINTLNECKLSFPSKISVHLDGSLLSRDQEIVSILDYVDILSSDSGDLYGCAVLKDN